MYEKLGAVLNKHDSSKQTWSRTESLHWYMCIGHSKYTCTLLHIMHERQNEHKTTRLPFT